MTIIKQIFKAVVEYYDVDVVNHALKALYIWVWVGRKITKIIDFILYLIMCLPEILIIPVKPHIVDKNGNAVKIISAIDQNGKVLTKKLNMYLHRYFDMTERAFNAKKLQEFIDISILMIGYIIVQDDLNDSTKTNISNQITKLVLELKEHVYKVEIGDAVNDRIEMPFGDVQF